ncbi:MAG: hypothetical protein ACRDN0_39130 [Trebonia sp.]
MLLHWRTRRHLSRRGKIFGAIAALLVAAVAAAVPAASARPAAAGTDTYSVSTVLIGSNGAIGALYQPTSPTRQEATAFVLTHEDANFIGTTPCVQLAQRGYTVMCVKSEFDDQAEANWDDLALDVGSSVSYLRGLATVGHVVLVGYSGGGAIMSFYQNVAQNGLSACQAPARLDPCGDDLANLPPADGVVLLDAIPGIAFSDLTQLDPSVVNESLNMFSPLNGYSATGSSDYSARFVSQYTAAQSAREAGLVARAEGLQDQIKNGTGQYSNDAPMPVGRDEAAIWYADLNLLSHTKGKFPLISPQYPDGSSPQVIHSVRVTSASAATNDEWSSSQGGFTADSFMSVAAIKAPDLRITADSITGVDWASTNTATVDNVAGIRSPMLIMSMTGHYWLVPAEMYYDAATQAPSKTLVYVEGATHGFTPCTACEKTPGEFGDTVAETFNYVASWAAQHYGT